MFEGDEKKANKGRDNKGIFLPGNKFWRNRERHGRKLTFETPELFYEACLEYFDWVDDNPLPEVKAFASGKTLTIPLMRAMTLRGLCRHMGIGRRSWDEYRGREDFTEVCEAAEDIMFEQKFTGAAAGLFNAAIIARDLGLADRTEVEGNLVIEVVDSYEDNDPE